MNEVHSGNLPRADTILHLLLARLLVPAKKPLGKSQWSRDVEQLAKHSVLSGSWAELFESCRQRSCEEGLVQEKPLGLTEAGREACLKFWQVESGQLPSPLTWQSLLRGVIVPHILGVPSELLRTKDPTKALTQLVVRRTQELPDSVRTQKDLLNALAWRELGIESTAPFTPAAVVASRVLQTERRLKPEEVVKNLAKSSLIPSEKDLFRAVVQKWIVGLAEQGMAQDGSPAVANPPAVANRPTPEPHAEEFSERNSPGDGELVQFADRVRQTARQSDSGWFGDNKVFISHVWRRLHEQPEFAATSLEQFKQRLVDAHRQQLLSLSRADLVERMDPRDVAESETAYLDARFHFIRL